MKRFDKANEKITEHFLKKLVFINVFYVLLYIIVHVLRFRFTPILSFQISCRNIVDGLKSILQKYPLCMFQD